jgi:hypothetical protein
VVKGKDPSWHPLGGLRFYGLWPILDVGIYHLRWWDLQLAEGGRQESVFHEEVIDYVLLKPDVYWVKVEAAETRPPERIPLNVEFLVTMRVENPYKAIFVAPINWVENTTTRLSALFRSLVASSSLDELLELKGDPQGIWKRLGKEPLLQKTLRREWGILVEKGGIEIRDIGIPPEYQEAAAAQRAEAMKAEGTRRRIEIEWGAIEKFGGLGRLVRTLEAVEKSPLAASLSVQAVPGLQEVLRGVFGKAPEALTPEECRALREVLKSYQGRGRKKPPNKR